MFPSTRTSYRRTSSLQRLTKLIAGLLIAWTFLETLYIRWAQIQAASTEPKPLGDEKVYIASMHWNDELVLRNHWIPAMVELVQEIGRENVYVSVQLGGSFDNSKDALAGFDVILEELGVARRIVLSETMHLDEISRVPEEEEEGWIWTPRGKKEVRRIPYLARLRNEVMRPFYELQRNGTGEKFDKVLWLNDVVFTTQDVRNLFSTRGGDYASACSLDFSRTNGHLYDTFALRDLEGREQIMPKWPYFRARESRRAIKASHPVPVASCWNGMVVMRAAPFYDEDSPLAFRGISDSLATSHLEGSECCLIHADNPLSLTKGVWMNPNVRVGYNASAYAAAHPSEAGPWVSAFQIVYGSWHNRLKRWFTTTKFKEMVVKRRLDAWKKESAEHVENGPFCLINEMQVLFKYGWRHV